MGSVGPNAGRIQKSGLNPGTAITPEQDGLLLSRPKGSLVPCADTFRDKLLLDGSQSREHKDPGKHQAVTHPSTKFATPCLTSVIARELVYPKCYALDIVFDSSNQTKWQILFDILQKALHFLKLSLSQFCIGSDFLL